MKHKGFLTLILIFTITCTDAQNVGIGTSSPNAMLDVYATNGGILIPRIALTGTGSAGPLTSPTVSTLVYNTATIVSGATSVSPGFYYWNGSAWVRVIDNASIGGATTVGNTSSANTLSTTVNGVTGSTVPIVNSVSNTSSVNTLSTTVNGVTGTGVNIINSNTLSLSGNTLTSTVNGVAPTQSLSGLSLSGDVTGTLAATTISANAVTYAKFQQVAASSLVGNPTGILANAGGITLGTGLAFSGTTLYNSSPSSGGTVTSIGTTGPVTGGTITGTGTIGCATCATTTTGGALSGTSPVAVSAAGAISCATCLTTGTISALANPSTLIGLSVTNGSGTTAMYANAAPAINPAITPTWTGTHTFSNATYSALFTGGNVGIGTTSPLGKLHVMGDINGTSRTSQLYISSYTNQNQKLYVGINGNNGATSGDYASIEYLQELQHWGNLALQADGGNVGIGTTAPGYKLDVAGDINTNTGFTISGAAASSNYLRGNGTNFVSSAILPADLSAAISGTTNYHAKFTGTNTIGNSLIYDNGSAVGIGTTTLSSVLTIDGTTPIVEIRSGGYLMLRPAANGWDMRLEAVSQRLDILSGGSLGTPIMSLLNGGNVGIGTTSPGFPLDVEITASETYSNYGACYAGGAGATFVASVQTTPVSIHASGRMTCSEFDAISDKRIKDIIGISDPSADLMTLNKIEVTDFKYKDKVQHGDHTKKGFIAQQVETVFQEAINKQTGFIPDIYAMSESSCFDAGKHTLTITLTKQHNLSIGDKVKIITAGERKEAVVNNIISGTQFSVGGWDKPTDTVFVYGREVNDFRVVDYDRIYTLNVSATQQLSKKLEEAQARIDLLTIENARLRSTTDHQSEMMQNMNAQIDAINERLNMTTGK